MARVSLFPLISMVLGGGLVMACGRSDGKSQQQGKEAAPALAPSNNAADKNSPDNDFYAENFARDALETDDDEAFGEPLTADDVKGARKAAATALQLDEMATEQETATSTATATATASDTGVATGSATSTETATSAQTSTDTSATTEAGDKVITPPSDDDPTAHDPQLIDLIVETIFGIADADEDGKLSRSEFVDTRYFPKDELSEKSLARLKERRTKLFELARGDDEFVDQNELADLLTAGRGQVRKLRLMRYLPYAEHLAKSWKAKWQEFDKDGDGDLSAEELKAFREARREQRKSRRAKLLSVAYGVCRILTDTGKSLPDWLGGLGGSQWGKHHGDETKGEGGGDQNKSDGLLASILGKLKHTHVGDASTDDDTDDDKDEDGQKGEAAAGDTKSRSSGLVADDEAAQDDAAAAKSETSTKEDTDQPVDADDPCLAILSKAEGQGIFSSVLDRLKQKGLFGDRKKGDKKKSSDDQGDDDKESDHQHHDDDDDAGNKDDGKADADATDDADDAKQD